MNLGDIHILRAEIICSESTASTARTGCQIPWSGREIVSAIREESLVSTAQPFSLLSNFVSLINNYPISFDDAYSWLDDFHTYFGDYMGDNEILYQLFRETVEEVWTRQQLEQIVGDSDS